MKPRNSVILAIVAVIVLVAGWVFGPASQPGVAASSAAGALVFPNLAPKLQGAAEVTITHQGSTLVIARQPDGVWGLAERGGFRVQQDKLRGLLTGLTELRMTEPRTADPKLYSRLGVGDPESKTATASLVRVLDKAGKPIAELIVGHRREYTSGGTPPSVYIRRPGEAQSWLAEGSLPVDSDIELWFDRDIVNVPKDQVVSVTVTRHDAAAGDTVLEFALVDGKPALTSPAEHPKLDPYRLADVFDSLDQLTLTDVQPVARQPGAPIGTAKIVTKDGMVVEVTVYKTGKDIWIRLAATGEGAAKAAAEALNKQSAGWTYQVGAWKEAALLPTIDAIKADEPDKKPKP
jgi:hypothetical protein